LKSAGLEIWKPVSELGGLKGFTNFCEEEVFPWLRDPQLSVRRLLCAGLPGTGKSYCAKWLAHRLGCGCARLSIPALKAGHVGESEGNLRRALRTIDAMAAHAPLVVVLDEIDTIARDGLDGGTSSGMFAELLTWLQESESQTLVVATLNRLDKLDSALESRFQGRFFYDLPVHSERKAVAEIWYRHYGAADVESAARATADYTDGFSSREIHESLIKSVLRTTQRKPTPQTIAVAASKITPQSKSHGEDLAKMRKAAVTLLRGNNPDEGIDQTPLATRRIAAN
jgi:SpoVK/Ycf46/Vps4 family AAA+-type ATPase